MIGLKGSISCIICLCAIFFLGCDRTGKFHIENLPKDELRYIQGSLISMDEGGLLMPEEYGRYFVLIRSFHYGGFDIVMSVKELAGDTMAVLSFTTIVYDWKKYAGNGVEKPRYAYPYVLKKISKHLHHFEANKLFGLLDSSVRMKVLDTKISNRGGEGAPELFYRHKDKIYAYKDVVRDLEYVEVLNNAIDSVVKIDTFYKSIAPLN